MKTRTAAAAALLRRMRSPSPSCLLIMLLVSIVALMSARPASAHMVELLPSKKECFFEDLNPGDQVSLFESALSQKKEKGELTQLP